MLLTVGGPWLTEGPVPPAGLHFTFRTTPELAVVFDGVTPEEARQFRHGKVEFALTARGPVLFLMTRMDGFLDWSDAPFTIHRVNAEDLPNILPPDQIDPNTHLVVTMLLVERQTNIIRSMRMLTLSPQFSLALMTCVYAQKAQPFDEKNYEAMVTAIQESESTHALAADAIARGFGGA